MRGEREELISSSLPSVELATGSARVREDNYEWATRGGFFRLNYIYNNKYIFEANGRYDGLLASPKLIVSVSFLLYQLLGLFHKRNLCMPPKIG